MRMWMAKLKPYITRK